MHGIDASTSAALYGKGVFTTIAIRDGEPFLWEKHWRRLTENAAKLSIDLSENTEAETHRLLKQKIGSVLECRARVTFFDESPSSVWPSPSAANTSVHIITGERRVVSDHFRFGISPYTLNSTSPLAGIKSCNYLEPMIAFEETKFRGFDEAVRLNEHGRVTSACMANIFWTKEAKLYTPSLATGCLSGTTREYVLENIETIEVEADMDTLDDAEQIFLTSAGLGVAAVSEFKGRKLALDDHPVLNLI